METHCIHLKQNNIYFLIRGVKFCEDMMYNTPVMKTRSAKKAEYKRIINRNKILDTKAKYILRWAKRIKAILYKGGKCEMCLDARPYVLVFHHKLKAEKEDSITNLITRTSRWSRLKDELDKCLLVCENCHREIHERSKDNKNNKNKKICLEFKGVNSCYKCGYSKCDGALEFHHFVSSEKSFGISKMSNRRRWKKVADLEQDVIDEINKCEVLCANCHKEHHFCADKFHEVQKEIYEKANNLFEKRELIDKDIVIGMISKRLGNGEQKRQVFKKVATELGCSYGRIYEIAREYGIKGHSVDSEKVLHLWKSGQKQSDIVAKTGYSKSQVRKIILENKAEGLFSADQLRPMEYPQKHKDSRK